MAIQIPNPGTGNGASGDNEFVLWSKVKDNFNNTTHAASRLVGTDAGNVMERGAFGLGGASLFNKTNESPAEVNELRRFDPSITGLTIATVGVAFSWASSGAGKLVTAISSASNGNTFYTHKWTSATVAVTNIIYTTGNTTKDANGFLKAASPIVDLYDDTIELNQDATEQGGITFEKLGVGDYLVKGSLGFAQDGWYIETPKDANGNVLVAVVYEQLENNDLSIKTYAKRFDDETGDIVANLAKPRDIPTGRFISLRLHELPQEPPVMPTETQTEV